MSSRCPLGAKALTGRPSRPSIDSVSTACSETEVKDSFLLDVYGVCINFMYKRRIHLRVLSSLSQWPSPPRPRRSGRAKDRLLQSRRRPDIPVGQQWHIFSNGCNQSTVWGKEIEAKFRHQLQLACLLLEMLSYHVMVQSKLGRFCRSSVIWRHCLSSVLAKKPQV